MLSGRSAGALALLFLVSPLAPAGAVVCVEDEDCPLGWVCETTVVGVCDSPRRECTPGCRIGERACAGSQACHDIICKTCPCPDFCEPPQSCVPPPSGLAAWWPFDETAGTTAADLGGNLNLGTYHDGPLPAPGMVAGALAFDGVDSFVRVNHSPSLALASGRFTLDFWIRPASGEVSGTIFRKGPPRPFDPLLLNGPGVHLVYQSGHFLAFAGSIQQDLSPTLTDHAPLETWTFVAVTFDLPGGVAKLYINGLLAKTTSFANSSVKNTEPVFIGGYGSGPDPQRSFAGSLDELELFDRVLSEQEIRSLFLAGSTGKCKEVCHTTWEAACTSPGTGNVDMTVCNRSTSPRSYAWTFTALPAFSALCNLDGPSAFNPSAGTTPVAAGSCATLPVQIQCPAGQPPEGHGCFELEIQNLATQTTTTCGGSYLSTDRWLVRPRDLIYAVPAARQVAATFDVTNLGPGTGTLNLTLAVLPSDMASPNTLVSIDGRPPGEPVRRFLSVPEGETRQVQATVSFAAHRPFAFHDLLASADLDGDGVAHEIASAGLYSQVDCNGNGVDDGVDLVLGTSRDCNGNAVPDSCDIAARVSRDCNRNGLLDSCEVGAGTVPDVNGNGRPDSCEVSNVVWRFDGIAQGGSVSATIQGFSAACTVTTTTVAGETASTVAAHLAAALNADPCLAAQGISATAAGNLLTVRGFTLNDHSVSEVVTDPGLQHVMVIPTLSTWSLLLVMALLATLGVSLIRRLW